MFDPRMNRKHHHEPMGFGMMPPHMYKRGIHPFRIHPAMIDELETKEDAIDLIEIEVKLIERRKKKLMRAIDRLDTLEGILSSKVSEIAKMEDFSKDKIKTLLKKTSIEYTKKRLEED
ncbi:MAG: hypothetical protein ACFFDW_09975 [Candidatus Thorarchaeota archaeon]